MRFLGLDIGSKTIGLAVSDLLCYTAQGIDTVRRSGMKNDLEHIKKVVEEYEVSTFVIGYPKNMNGTIGERAIKSEEFAQLLKDIFPDKKIILWDERLTTMAAQKVLIEADVRREKRKKVVDKLAAVLILQGYLDSCRQ